MTARKNKNWIESVNHAVSGIFHAVRTEQNMRVHALIALLVLAAALVLGVSRFEAVALLLAIGFVMVAELINTAIEAAVDLVTSEIRPLARIAKDVAAGAVLIAAITSVFVGAVIFFPRLSDLADASLDRLASVPEVVALAALSFVLIVVVLIKAEVTPFRIQGGFPSAHSAVAFALATLIFLSGASGTIVLLSGALAFLVGQSRVEARIHSIYEVTAGALIGIFATVLVARLLAG